jgi:hypothetical protein
VKVNQPQVLVAARPGYIARPPMARAATPTMAPAPNAVQLAMERLGRLSSTQELFGYAVLDDTGLAVVGELASRDLERGRWAKGAAMTVTVTTASGSSLEASGSGAAGQRSAMLHVPLAGDRTGPFRVRVRVSGDGDPAEERFEVRARDASGAFLGEPIAYRAGASLRAPLQPLAEFQLRRNERLHVEWPLLKSADDHTVQILDRTGQPLPFKSALTARTPPDGRPVGVLDVPLTGLSAGDYLIEVTARSGADIERGLLAFRVVQ